MGTISMGEGGVKNFGTSARKKESGSGRYVRNSLALLAVEQNAKESLSVAAEVLSLRRTALYWREA